MVLLQRGKGFFVIVDFGMWIYGLSGDRDERRQGEGRQGDGCGTWPPAP